MKTKSPADGRVTRLRPLGFAVAGDIRFREAVDILPCGQGDIRSLGGGREMGGDKSGENTPAE